jgi:hypothetical protein
MSNQVTTSQTFNHFLQFFEWTYDVRFSFIQKQEIAYELEMGWGNADKSDLELVNYILQLHQIAFGIGRSQQQHLKPQAQAFLRELFSRLETNDRGRVLDTLHRTIEEISPGVTQIATLPKPRFTSLPPAQASQGNVAQAPYDTLELNDQLARKRAEQMRSLNLEMDQYIWNSRMENARNIWRG